MTGVALKGLAGRKLRALLTALAVVIGVSMVAGTFVLTDTMQKSFNGLFSASLDKTDAVIGGKEIVQGSTNGSGVTVPAGLVERDPVAARGRGGRRHRRTRRGQRRRHHRRRRQGRGEGEPRHELRRRERALQPAPAQDRRLAAGRRSGRDRRRHGRQGAPRRRRRRRHRHGRRAGARTGSPAPPATATWTRSASAASPCGTSRPRSACSTARAASTPSRSPRSPARRRTSSSPRWRRSCPDELEVKDSAKQAEDDAAQLNKGMKMIRLFLLGFGLIALLVGAFVIFNTLSITVAQRTREFATLRTLGASRKQVMRSVVLEGLVIGLVASVLGILAGFGISEGMIRLFSALGVDLPDAPTVVALRTIVVSLLLGTGVTLLASVLPARRATRVPPISAVREGARAAGVARAVPARGRRRPARLARRGLARDLRRRGGRAGRAAARRRASSGCSPGSRCSRRASSSRSPAWWAGRRGVRVASRASSPAPTPSATPAAPRRPPPR